ncbi:hypothetical protein LCGC14_1008190, partial [marine sediment metagenome]
VVSNESSVTSEKPKIDVDQNGNAYVVWYEQSEVFYKIWNATTNNWTLTGVVSAESAGASNEPDIAIDNAGNVHVVWHDYTDDYLGSGSDEDVFYKRWNATSKSWTITELVSIGSTGPSRFAEIAVDSDGNAHVTWSDLGNDYMSSGSDSDIFYRRWDATSNIWTIVEVASILSNGASEFPEIATDLFGNAHITWQDFTYDNIYYNNWNATSKTWSSSRVVSSTNNVEHPSISTDIYGNVHIVWHNDSSSQEAEIFYKRWNMINNTWTNAKIISTTGATADCWKAPAIASGKKGDTHIIWPDYTSGDWDIYYRKLVIDYGTPEILITSPSDKAYTDEPSMINISAIDPNLDQVWYTIGTVNIDLVNNVEQLLDSTIWNGLNQGEFIIYIFANDTFGNKNFKNITLYKDTEAPITSINYQPEKAPNYIFKSTSLNINSSDIVSGVFNISYKIDSGTWKNFSNPFNLSGYSHGTHTIYYFATDNVGNIEVINQEIIFLDLQGPNVTFSISPLYLSTITPQYYDTQLNINCTVQDDTSIIGVLLCENSTGLFVNRTMSSNGTYSFILDISSLNWGDIIMLSFYANDSAGNIGMNNNGGLNYSIRIYDSQDPATTLSFQSIENPNFATRATLFTFSASDSINGSSGVYNISYKIDLGIWNLYSTPFNLTGSSHGNHTIYYYATDNAGNTEVINQDLIFLDLYSPNITFSISPLYLSTIIPQFYHTELIFNCTVQDDTPITAVYLSENSTGNFVNRSMSELNGKYWFNLDISPLNWGDIIVWSFYANDSVGNIEWDNNDGLYYSIQISDFQDPSTSLNFQAIKNPNIISTSTFFTFNTSDGINGSSGIHNISYRIDLGNWNLFSTPFNLTGFSHGNHTIYYFATDNAGNTEIINQELIILDLQGPNITFSISPLYMNPLFPQFYHTELIINCTVQDEISIATVYLCENSTGTFMNRTMSKLGGSYTFTLDITNLNWTNSIVFTFYANDSASNLNWNNNGGLNYTIQIYDSQNPLTSLYFQTIKNPNFISKTTLFSLNASDSFNGSLGSSGVYNISYKIDLGSWNLYSNPFNLIGFSHGNHTIYYYATDHANNFELINQQTIFLDLQPPNINFSLSLLYLSTLTPQYFETELKINCTAQDDISVFKVYLCENSTGIFLNRTMTKFNGSYFFNLDVSSLNWSNIIFLSFYANDSAGNIKWDNNGGLYYAIQIYDFLDPVTSIGFNLGFSPNFVNKLTLFSLSVNDDNGIGGSGYETIEYNIDNNSWNIYNGPFNLSGYNEGLHTIYFNGTDYAGNLELPNQITIYLDSENVSSFIDFSYYEDSGIKYVNNFTQFNITWNDGTGSGLQNIYYKIDSGAFSPYSGLFTMLGNSEGFHNITYYTIDNVGNLEPEKSVIVYLDVAALSINLNYDVIYGLNYVDENIIFTITTFEDLGSGIKTVKYKLDEGTWINETIFDLIGLTLGEHTVYYRVEDNMGKYNEKLELIFLITYVSDLDNDGLTYQEELNLLTDPFNDDTDGDKLLDGDEVNLYYTNPLSKDTDGDGYSDYDEIFIYRTDPNNAMSSLTINITIFLTIFSAVTSTSIIGVKKWKSIHKRRVEDAIITRISDENVTILDYKLEIEKLQKVKSKLNYEDILKEMEVSGKFILNGAIFVKNTGVDKFASIIQNMVKQKYNQNLSKQLEDNLVRLNIKDIERDERIIKFIKKLEGEK